MPKTDKQLLLESLNDGKDLKQILSDAFESHRGEKNMVLAVAVEMKVSHMTVYEWCRNLGIDITTYR